MGRLQGRRVLVTAAGAGIGRACADRFAAEGAMVWATDVDDDAMKTLAAPNISTHRVDGVDAEAVATFASSLPPLDGVVHCIGRVDDGTVLDTDYESWRRAFQVNVDTFYHVLRGVLPPMLDAKVGSIVCISSVASSLKGLPRRAVYGASKAALIGIMKAVAVDFASQGLRCNAICPGTILTPSLDGRIAQLAESLGGRDAAQQAFVSRQPMGRLGTPEEVASLALYLLSDESTFITGQALAVDGGITI